jgi:opacity protein-like surface antigen
MRSGFSVLSIAGALLYSSFAISGESGIQSMLPTYRPVISLTGGYANMDATGKAFFLGDDESLFAYDSRANSRNGGVVGGFLGMEHSLPWYGLLAQAGLEYNYFTPIQIRGEHTVGMEPDYSTLYQYHYQFQSQQFLASFKILATNDKSLHPYVQVGLGAAWNRVGRFSATTTETGNINLTPSFNDHTRAEFSYNLGAGLDFDVSQNVRIGFGYRFSGLGNASLTGGQISIGDSMTPVSFAVGMHNVSKNQLIAHISYVK